MPQHAIPSAYLVRALARREAEHCNRCGHRMFVKGRSGLCPFCLADRPVRPIEHAAPPVTPAEPFAPRLGETMAWRRFALSGRLRELAARVRRGDARAHAPG
ncbi:MAG: hypothetical protein DCC71_21760 [Proteobacteria bacterium]|nr:MAG: hypothetical protein DCC71_21760 [Pseudomonadota bacterium]